MCTRLWSVQSIRNYDEPSTHPPTVSTSFWMKIIIIIMYFHCWPECVMNALLWVPRNFNSKSVARSSTWDRGLRGRGTFSVLCTFPYCTCGVGCNNSQFEWIEICRRTRWCVLWTQSKCPSWDFFFFFLLFAHHPPPSRLTLKKQ